MIPSIVHGRLRAVCLRERGYGERERRMPLKSNMLKAFEEETGGGYDTDNRMLKDSRSSHRAMHGRRAKASSMTVDLQPFMGPRCTGGETNGGYRKIVAAGISTGGVKKSSKTPRPAATAGARVDARGTMGVNREDRET